MAYRRRLGWLCSALCLTACAGPPPPPATPASPVAYSGPGPAGLAFESPSNWSTSARDGDGGEQFVTLFATPAERLVLGHLPDQEDRSLEAFAGELNARVAKQFPGTLTGDPKTVTVAGRPALKLGFQTQAGNRGVRYVIQGGWLVEYEARPAYADELEPDFEAVVASLNLPRSP